MTRKIVHAIAKGMDIDALRRSSLTHPRERMASLPPFAEGVLPIGMPAYKERIPAVIKQQNTCLCQFLLFLSTIY
jgi:hypothetical protein